MLGKGILGGIASGHTMGGLVIRTGSVNGKKVEVLSDSGCNGIVVRRDLVYDDQMLDRKVECRMINGQSIVVSVARITINTPYLQGEVDAWVLDNPLCDLIVGNVPGIGNIMEGGPKAEAEAQAVVTRGQHAEVSRPYPKMKVPEIVGLNKSRAEIRELQRKDESLASCREHVKNRIVKQTRSGETTWVYIDGTLYRQFQSGGGQKHYQLVVPTVLRAEVMKLGHETVMAGHLGSRKTTNRIISESYWPGCMSDITRFCRSCDICQRTVPRGRVSKVSIQSITTTPYQVKKEMDYMVNMKGRAKIVHANMLKVDHERDIDEVGAVVAIEVNETNHEVARYESDVVTAVERVDQRSEEQALAAVFVDVIEEVGGKVQQEGVDQDDNGQEEIGPLLYPLVEQESYKDVVVAKDLSIEQQKQVTGLLKEFHDVLTDKPGTTDVQEMEIKVETPESVRSCRGYPYHVRDQTVAECRSRLPEQDRARIDVERLISAQVGKYRYRDEGILSYRFLV